ncbi:hypothetical protein AWC16_17920 [Mycolicibacter longobardus]|uniref:13e12 repeat-containing protein n=1 Tax=Mycolicibacter longobardus TaxID=1108812 RepID=A0A1X1YDV5_9MYCO|nr:hypothetical protein AWC16_17920 [Mycolicibacter longobardus]
MKTFWGWRDQQLPDGTLILTSPSGQTYVTTPGSSLLFPRLCVPTGGLPAPRRPSDARCGDRTAMMPRRRRTRAQDRAARINSERNQNRQARQARRANHAAWAPWSHRLPAGIGDDDPPPF